MNPRTRNCVKASGRVAQGLVRRGDVNPIYGAPGPAPGRRATVRRPRAPAYGAPPAYGYGPPTYGGPATGYGAPATGYGAIAPAAVYIDPPCPYGQERNPQTGRCVKIGGRTYKKVRGPAPAPPAYRAAPTYGAAAPAYGGPQHLGQRHRAATEPYIRSMLAPMTDQANIVGWTRAQCKNQVDPLTGRAFVSQDTASLQQLVRLHNRTCVSSNALKRQVDADRSRGITSVIPGTYDPLNATDYESLAASQRRVGAPTGYGPSYGPAYGAPTGPSYGFPTTAAPAPSYGAPGLGRVKAPRPPEWQLYIAQDTRSGPDYASVLIVDVTKAKTTAYGTEYPHESIRVDLGFIPVTGTQGAACTPQTLVDRIQRKDKKGALIFLDPGSGRWKPIAPFPLLKTFWTTGRAAKLGQICSALTT